MRPGTCDHSFSPWVGGRGLWERGRPLEYTYSVDEGDAVGRAALDGAGHATGGQGVT